MGKPLGRRLTEQEKQERMERFTDRSGECHIWTGPHDSSGYPIVTWNTKIRLVTRRVVAEHLGRPLGPGMQACHHCDVPSCINPVHLYEGTPRQNAHDRRARNPGSYVRGESHGNTPLTEMQVHFVRAWRSLAFTQKAIAKALKVSASTVANIEHGRTWGHLDDLGLAIVELNSNDLDVEIWRA